MLLEVSEMVFNKSLTHSLFYWISRTFSILVGYMYYPLTLGKFEVYGIGAVA